MTIKRRAAVDRCNPVSFPGQPCRERGEGWGETPSTLRAGVRHLGWKRPGGLRWQLTRSHQAFAGLRWQFTRSHQAFVACL